jgi:hypothetical protein
MSLRHDIHEFHLRQLPCEKPHDEQEKRKDRDHGSHLENDEKNEAVQKRERKIRRDKEKSFCLDLAVGLTGNREFRVIRARVFLRKGDTSWSCHK